MNEQIIWEGDRVRVLTDGTWEFFGETIREWLPGNDSEDDRIDALARALAEAKRETAEAARQAIQRFASRLGDDATGHDADCSLEELELALYRHVMDEEKKSRQWAAEAMRERARALALEHKAGFLAEAIGALPLEAK